MTSAPRSDLSVGLQAILDGRWAATRDQVRGFINDRNLVPRAGVGLAEYREYVVDELRAMVPLGFPAYGFGSEAAPSGDPGAAVTAIETLGYGDLSVMVKGGVQWGLFGGAIENLGTQRHHDQYRRGTIELDTLGCFAMTETGHGSNVQALETTATYLPGTDEFEIHSPTPSSRKDYIGGAGAHARVGAVFAQLITGGPGEEPRGRGVHCFVVPLRDADGNDLPGVTTSDCGYKGGLPGVDNGRILFDRVRIPRTALLNRYAEVATDGTYSSPIESDNRRFFTMLGTLMRGRVTVGAAGGAAGRLALTLAVKYALHRRQFTGPGGDQELHLIDYRAHQRRLLPLVARTYAFAIAQNALVEKLHELQSKPAGEADPAVVRRLETEAAALKAGHTELASAAAIEARTACGGAGYMAENRLTLIRDDVDVFTTFEGDNLILTQLVAKSLLTEYASDFGDLDAAGWIKLVGGMARDVALEKSGVRQFVQTVFDRSDEQVDDSELSHPATQLGLLHAREDHLVRTAASRMRRATKGDDALEVFTQTQDHLITAGRAHIDRIVAEALQASINELEAGSAVRETLESVRNLFVYATLEADLSWFLMHRFVSVERAKAVRRGVNELCAELAPIAGDLVDAFGIPDVALDVPMLTSPASTA